MSEKLKREVWDLERCTGCGMCVATCFKGVLDFFEEKKHPSLERKRKILGLSESELDPCYLCKAPCIESCPRLVTWENGRIESILSGKSKIPLESGQPVDIAISLLCAAFESGLIDRVLLIGVDKWTFKPTAKFVCTPQELTDSMLNPYVWTPLLKPLGSIRTRKIAVVGTPCIAQALKRTMDSAASELENFRESIRLVIGLFCSGIFPYNFVAERIIKDMKIPAWKIRRIDVNHKIGKILVTLHDGSSKEISLPEAQKYTPRGCASCNDFAAEWADISIGTVGSDNGYSTLIVRSPVGKECLLNAQEREFLETTSKVNTKELDGFIENKKKRSKAEETDSLLLNMLDALHEPEKIPEVEKKFSSTFLKKTLKQGGAKIGVQN